MKKLIAALLLVVSMPVFSSKQENPVLPLLCGSSPQDFREYAKNRFGETTNMLALLAGPGKPFILELITNEETGSVTVVMHQSGTMCVIGTGSKIGVGKPTTKPKTTL